MPLTLAQARLNVQDDLQMGVIDEFAKNNYLLDKMIFDDAVSPTGGGATLTYSYTRVKTQPTAQFRAINSEYVAQETEKERFSSDLKVFGGAFELDRIIANMGGITNEVTFQMQQKIKAASALFSDTVINGDAGVNANSFDGLEKALTGSTTEIKPGVIDLSTSALITTNYMAFLDILDEFLSSLNGPADALLVNTKMAAKIRACARRASMYGSTLNNFGQQVEQYGNIPFIDLGAKPGSNNGIIATDGTSGQTSIYAVCLGLDGFHGISMANHPIIKTILPDYKTAGAVKKGEVEMVAAVALKATKAAGVLREIKVK